MAWDWASGRPNERASAPVWSIAMSSQSSSPRPLLRWAVRLALAGVALAPAPAALASEAGTSLYLLGSGGPGAAILPPVRGIFFDDTFYHYDGKASAERPFLVGGNLVAGLKANVNANFATVLWTPTTNFLGGTVGLAGLLPMGDVAVDVSAVLTGPRGRAVSIARSDNKFIVGDPVLLGEIGWTRGKSHLTLSTLINIPIGDYRPDQLANLAFHRWATDFSAAATWHDKASGWDLSAKTGVTFNGKNPHTDYKTGTEWHIEAAVEKRLSPAFTLGAQVYHFDQLSGDSGEGATLGPFKGRVTGLGGTASYNFKIGPAPASLRLRGFKEFDVQNRLKGNAVFLEFAMPLHVVMPPGHTASGPPS
jgi:hypothetical protein